MVRQRHLLNLQTFKQSMSFSVPTVNHAIDIVAVYRDIVEQAIPERKEASEARSPGFGFR